MLTKEQKDKMLDEALSFVKMSSPHLVATTFVAMAGMYMVGIQSMRNKELQQEHLKFITQLLGNFPVEVTELIVGTVLSQEIDSNDYRD